MAHGTTKANKKLSRLDAYCTWCIQSLTSKACLSAPWSAFETCITYLVMKFDQFDMTTCLYLCKLCNRLESIHTLPQTHIKMGKSNFKPVFETFEDIHTTKYDSAAIDITKALDWLEVSTEGKFKSLQAIQNQTTNWSGKGRSNYMSHGRELF